MTLPFFRDLSTRRWSAAPILAFLYGGAALAQLSAQNVLTDTPAYCSVLLDRISQLGLSEESVSPEANRLTVEGRRMCEAGLIRGGVARLRRALALIRNPQPDPP